KRGPTLLAESRCGGVVELARRARHWITRLPRRTYRPKSRNHSAIRPRRALNLAPRLSEPTVSGDNTPRRPERHRKIADWPPDGGVCCEPVPMGKFPDPRENTGNFAVLRQFRCLSELRKAHDHCAFPTNSL